MAGGPAAFSGVPDTPASLTASRCMQRVRTLLRGCAAAVLLGCGGASGPSGPTGAGVVTSVQINTGAATVVVGATVSLTATARDVNGATVAGAVTSWSSAATSVATISAAGVATGVAAGTTTITASSAGINAAIQLTVTPDDTPASVTLAPPGPIALVSGGVITIVPTVRAADGHVVGTAAVVYGSSDATVASVSAGVITAAKAGSATITATSGTASASVAVTVSAGAPSALAVRTQPGGSAVGALLTTQPVIEIRDKAGNLVPTATNAVTVAIATGDLPYAFDQTFIANMVLSYRFDNGISVGTTLHFNTGRPESGELTSRTKVLFTDRLGLQRWVRVSRDESVRLPAFFRVDLRVAKTWLTDKLSIELYLDVLNVLVREEVLGYSYLVNRDGSLSKLPTSVPVIIPNLGLKVRY